MSWQDEVTKLTESLGRKPALDELLARAKTYQMTPEEIEEQRRSWVLANVSTGDPRFD